MNDNSESLTTRLPEMSDMFVAGLPLREAYLLSRQIEANPKVAPEVWWQMINLPPPPAAS